MVSTLLSGLLTTFCSAAELPKASTVFTIYEFCRNQTTRTSGRKTPQAWWVVLTRGLLTRRFALLVVGRPPRLPPGHDGNRGGRPTTGSNPKVITAAWWSARISEPFSGVAPRGSAEATWPEGCFLHPDVSWAGSPTLYFSLLTGRIAEAHSGAASPTGTRCRLACGRAARGACSHRWTRDPVAHSQQPLGTVRRVCLSDRLFPPPAVMSSISSIPKLHLGMPRLRSCTSSG